MSIIRADSIKNRSGAGAPDFPNGITVTGIVTSTILNSTVNNVSADDFVNVGSNIQLGNAGVVTATTFKGNIDAVDGDFDGTLEADAITVNGTALNTVIAGVTVTNSTNASIATNVTVADESSDTTCFPTFVTAATGDLPPKTGSNLSFNSSSGQLTATSFAGSGANLTSIPAGNLTGTVADARISTLTASKLTGALPAISGSNLTGLTANSIGALAGITIRKDDGVVGSANSVSSINFVGAAVTFTNPTSGIATVTISSGGDSASPVMMSMIFG